LEELFQEVKKGGELVANKLRELEEKDTSTSEKGSVLVDKNVVELKGNEDTNSIDKNVVELKGNEDTNSIDKNVVELKGNEDTSIIDKKRSNHAMK
jgi:hypothetical protein